MDYLFNDYIKLYQNIEATEWVTIFEENGEKNYENDIFTFCALIKTSKEDLKKYLSNYDWGFKPDSFGKATFIQYGDDEIEYISGDKTGEFEYLIALRDFNKYPKIYEINPKLIWYGNLRHIGSEYRNPKTNDIEIKAMEHKVEVRLSYLKDFLAANKSFLSIVFDHRRYFKKDTIKSRDSFRNYSTENSFIFWGMSEVERLMDLSAKYDYNSSIIGKVVIEPYSKPRHEDYKWFFDSEKYESFIIGIDEDGEDIEHICKEANLANHYGANPESHHFLTPTNLSVPEYQQFLMKLCKITAESINTKLFQSIMGDKYDGSKGSIGQLDDFLKHIGLDNNGVLYTSIKKAYDSRNKLAGHRASMKEYNKVWGRDANFEANTITDAKSLLAGIIDALEEFHLSKNN